MHKACCSLVIVYNKLRALDDNHGGNCGSVALSQKCIAVHVARIVLSCPWVYILYYKSLLMS